MKYNILSVKEALEVLYCLGYEEISVSDFLTLFCRKYKQDEDKQERRVRQMLNLLAHKENIEIIDDNIRLDKLSLSKGLRCRLNDMEVFI